MTFRIVVTGGRFYSDQEEVARVLSFIDGMDLGPIRLAHGAASGLDTIAGTLAKQLGWEVVEYPVTREDWRTKGRRAGHHRNRVMLLAESPDVLIAFPGGAGTRNCVQSAHDLRIPVRYSHMIGARAPRKQ